MWLTARVTGQLKYLGRLFNLRYGLWAVGYGLWASPLTCEVCCWVPLKHHLHIMAHSVGTLVNVMVDVCM
jgi:hypothetical protein